MKQILNMLANFLIFLIYTFRDLALMFWYGRLPKVSVYHRHFFYYEVKDVFNDEKAQSSTPDFVSSHCKKMIINQYLTKLYNNPEYRENIAGIAVPIFNGKEIIGTTSVHDIFEKTRDNYIK